MKIMCMEDNRGFLPLQRDWEQTSLNSGSPPLSPPLLSSVPPPGAMGQCLPVSPTDSSKHPHREPHHAQLPVITVRPNKSISFQKCVFYVDDIQLYCSVHEFELGKFFSVVYVLFLRSSSDTDKNIDTHLEIKAYIAEVKQ